MSADNFTGQNISSTFQRLLQLSDNGNYITNGTGSVVQLIAVTSSYALTASYVAGVTSPVTPGGPNTSIQFNSGGYFSGSSKLLWAENDDQLLLIPSYGDQLVLGLNTVAGYDVGVFNGSDGIIATFDRSGSAQTFRYSNNNYKFDGNVSTHQFTGSVVAPNITGSLLGTASYALTASYVAGITSINTSSFITTGSNTSQQAITGSLDITGSFGLFTQGTTPPTGTPSRVGLFYFTDTDLYISLQ